MRLFHWLDLEESNKKTIMSCSLPANANPDKCWQNVFWHVFNCNNKCKNAAEGFTKKIYNHFAKDTGKYYSALLLFKNNDHIQDTTQWARMVSLLSVNKTWPEPEPGATCTGLIWKMNHALKAFPINTLRLLHHIPEPQSLFTSLRLTPQADVSLLHTNCTFTLILLISILFCYCDFSLKDLYPTEEFCRHLHCCSTVASQYLSDRISCGETIHLKLVLYLDTLFCHLVLLSALNFPKRTEKVVPVQ